MIESIRHCGRTDEKFVLSELNYQFDLITIRFSSHLHIIRKKNQSILSMVAKQKSSDRLINQNSKIWRKQNQLTVIDEDFPSYNWQSINTSI